MKLDPIVMDRTEARKAFVEYRNAFRKHAREIDAEIMRGYRALAQGKQLISLPAAIKAGGVVEHTVKRWDGSRVVAYFPRLACINADASTCFCDVLSDGAIVFKSKEYTRAESQKVKLSAGTLPHEKPVHASAKAIVPMVPPQYRPPNSSTLAGYHILFEAEWSMIPPKDPALLKHIGGDLYAVLAVWDLTEVERHVLALFNRAP